jgi:uncharacterized membrane protein
MNKAEITIGVIFMAVGTLVFFIGQPINNLLGQSINTLFYKLVGVFLLLAGFIVSILGVIALEPKEKTEKDSEQKQADPPNRV